MTWQKESYYEGVIHQGCLSCSPVERVASMDMLIAVGFGFAAVTKDGELVYQEPIDTEGWDDFWTVADAEEVAKGDPDHDWRIIKEAPLRSQEYQRHGDGKWVLIDSGPGFA